MALLNFTYVLLFLLGIPMSSAIVKPANESSLLTFLKEDLINRNGRKCHDFCAIMPEWCRNGGTCITEESTCVGSCICTIFWTGQRCEIKRQVDPRILSTFLDVFKNNSQNTDHNEKNIHDETTHGNINRSEISDQILALLHGLNINSDLLKDDTSESGNGHVKDHLDEVSPSLSHSDTNFTQSTTPSHNLSRSECINSCNNGDCIKINGQYKCKHRIDASMSDMQKVCGPGFVCFHGVCDLEAKENNSYDCICESNYVGQFCDYECPFDCGQHGFCDYDVSDSSYKCFCQWNYTGYNCSELIPTETETIMPHKTISFHWYVLGASVTIVILILMGTLLAGYLLWKRRLVFVLKIVHFFQEYEDDDGKEFDAFVSYKSTERDEKFVLTQLFPRLEGSSKFRLCLHFRDFEPGEAIANNIVRAIENSRRTIMILSPAYVKSEWCRMEYQKAQHEMLKLKHKIIPIVLEDISEVRDIDTNLKSILDSVTYLEWPGTENDKKVERFWTKLELSLPKKSDSSRLSSQVSPECQRTSSSVSGISTAGSCPTSDNPATSVPITSEIDDRPQTLPPEIPPTPKMSERRRKNFKHFIDKFVGSKLSFNRQDSSSSQVALVDEETAGSRSSCDSVSESILTESTESMCSTPVTTHTYLDDQTGEPGQPSSYFSVSKRYTEKENQSRVCEKDHCEGVECLTCLELKAKSSDNEISYSTHDTNIIDDICELCKLEQGSSDCNRIKISVIEGSDQIRIQKLVGPNIYRRCNHSLKRDSIYQGSLKNRKEAVNRELMMLNRAGTLPRNFHSRVLVRDKNAVIESAIGDQDCRSVNEHSDARAIVSKVVTDQTVPCSDSIQNASSNVTNISGSHYNFQSKDRAYYMDICETV